MCVNLRLRWGLKQSCSPHQKISNDMWHATWKQGNWGNFWLLVVRSQIANLTLDFSFGHNLCFKYPNGSCQPILDIYVPRVSNDIRNFSIQWVLTFVIALWKFGSPLGFQFPKWGLIWECGGSFPHTLLHSREHEVWLPGSLLACVFASPCLGHEPKARVAIMCVGMVGMSPKKEGSKNNATPQSCSLRQNVNGGLTIKPTA